MDLKERVGTVLASLKKQEDGGKTIQEKEKEELKLELITFEDQKTRTGARLKPLDQAKEEDLKLELVYDSPSSTLHTVSEHAAKLEKQRTQMDAKGGVEVLRGSSGLGAAQLAAIRKHEEQQKVTQGVEVLRGASGLGAAQLAAMRNHEQQQKARVLDQDQEHAQAGGAKTMNRLIAEPTSAKPPSSIRPMRRVGVTAKTVVSSMMAMPSKRAANTMAKLRKRSESQEGQSAESLLNAIAVEEHARPQPRAPKFQKEEEEGLKLELITYEDQGIVDTKFPKDQEDLRVEFVYEPGPHQVSAVGDQVAKLEQQRAEMEKRGQGMELLRGCLGLSTAQLDTIRKHEEQMKNQGLEILRASSGLQKAQLDAIRKRALASPAPDQSTPPESIRGSDL